MFQEAVSVADIVLWAALYPLLSDSSLALGKHSQILFIHSFIISFLLFFFYCIFQYFYFQLFCSQCLEPLPYFSGEWKSVKAWFDRGALMHSFQSAAQKVLQGKGLQGMKSYMQRQPAPQSSQSRETQPCNSFPAEVLAGSLRYL